MFIKLNRFLTADEVREKYQIPADLFQKLLPLLPVAHRDGAGVAYYLESVVDKVLHDWAARPPKADGPVPPDRFRLGDIECEGLTGLEWRLLDGLWGKPAKLIQDVMDRVYGDNHAQTDGAIKAVVKRLNKKLLKKGVPAEVVFKNGYCSIELRG
jgi:hypothetical protein